jgi:invasion protein IalB
LETVLTTGVDPGARIRRAIATVAVAAAAALSSGHAVAQLAPPAPKQPVRPVAPAVTPVPRPQPPAATGPAPPATGETQSAAAPSAPAPTTPAAKPPGTGWIARCISESRQSPVECSMERTVALSNGAPNTQLYASMLVRVPSDTRAPVLLIQVPNGFFLPAGLNLQIDDGKSQLVPLQTCDQKGCYASTPVTAELLAALKSGKRLTITLQNMAKGNVIVPVALDNFAEAYQRIQ